MTFFGRVASNAGYAWIRVNPASAVCGLKSGDAIELHSLSGHPRAGVAIIESVDEEEGAVTFTTNLNAAIPAAIESDVLTRYVPPCTRCRCDACNIPIAQTPESVHTLPARGMPDDLSTLEAAVLKMRALGVTKWNGIELGPEPPTQADDADEPSGLSAEDRVKAARAERQRVAALASGGPVKSAGRPQ
jgi:hypothetical protein